MVKHHPSGFKTEDAYAVNKPGGAFRPGEPAKIIDLVWLTPEGGEPRLCVHLLYPDGAEDYAVYDLLQMDLISETDYKNGHY